MSKPSFTKHGKLPLLYSRTASGQINLWQCSVVGPYVVTSWGQKDGAMQEARFLCKPKNEGRSNATTAEEQARVEAIAKWVKQKKLKYSESLDEAATEQRIKPMLAKEYFAHSKKLNWPVLVQPKLDGLRCLAYLKDGEVVLQSRGGEYFKIKHIAEAVKTYFKPTDRRQVILDGEIYCHGMSLQTVVSAARVYNEELTQQLRYITYDVLDQSSLESDYDTRRYWLNALVEVTGAAKRTPSLATLVTSWCDNEQALMEYLETCEQLGFEGVMVRDPVSMYRAGYRSPGLLKLKTFDEKEYKIIDWEVGKGKMKDCPIFECKMPNSDVTFNVVPVGTQEDRNKLLRKASSVVGKWMTVRHWGLTDAGKPKFPQGVLIRGKKAI